MPQLKNEDGVSYPSVSLPSTSKSKAPLKALSNPAQALAHLEKHQAKLAGLPEDRRKEIEERERWAKAEERAKGGKVADQEGTLKKAVKRLEKKKSKSGKEWSVSQRQMSRSESCSYPGRTERRSWSNRTLLLSRSVMIISRSETRAGRTRRWGLRIRIRAGLSPRVRARADLVSRVARRAREGRRAVSRGIRSRSCCVGILEGEGRDDAGNALLV